MGYMLDKYSERIYLQADVNRGSNAEKGIHLMQYCIPDVIICRKDSKKPVMVIDAKYKPDDKPVREDSHQLLSYVLLTGVITFVEIDILRIKKKVCNHMLGL